MECSISFQNGDPNLGKPSGAHGRRSAARAGRPQGFWAGVPHFAGWCLHAAALLDGGQRLPFRLSDSGVRSGSETRDAGHHAGHSWPAEVWECAGSDPRYWPRRSPPGGRAVWALPLCNIPEWLVSFQNDKIPFEHDMCHLSMICVI